MKILIFAGPSGGHLFPAMAFADHCRQAHSETQTGIVVTARVSPFLKAWLLAGQGKVYQLPEFPFPSFFSLKAPKFLLELGKGFVKTREILREFRPDVIVAFGTFVGFPGVVLGRLKGIPTVLHEQNVEPGRANKALVPFVKKVAVTFPATLDNLPHGKGVLIGNILRPEMILEAKKIRGLSRGKFQILVLGGSQGSSRLNREIFNTFSLMSPEETQKIAVIHITGTADFQNYENAYDHLGIENEVFPFSDEMPALYASSQLVISRAGAGTLAEIMLFGLPSILIPYPHAGSHQSANARYLAERGAARLIEETSLTPEALKAEILSLFGDEKHRESMALNAAKLARPNAGKDMVSLVESILEKREAVS